MQSTWSHYFYFTFLLIRLLHRIFCVIIFSFRVFRLTFSMHFVSVIRLLSTSGIKLINSITHIREYLAKSTNGEAVRYFPQRTLHKPLICILILGRKAKFIFITNGSDYNSFNFSEKNRGELNFSKYSANCMSTQK